MQAQIDLALWPRQLQAFETEATELLFGGATEGGKALSVYTQIPTPSGWVSMADIAVGDWVFDARGEPTIVVATTPVMYNRPCYRVSFDNGDSFIADADHQWVTLTAAERAKLARLTPEFRARRRKIRPKTGSGKRNDLAAANACRPYEHLSPPQPKIRTTAEIRETLLGQDGRRNHAVSLCGPLRLGPAKLPISSYVLGCWLGDGNSDGNGIACNDPEIIEAIRAEGYEVSKRAAKYAWGILGLTKPLKEAGLIKNKHVPPAYLRASEGQRRALLQGLMDTDGHCTRQGSCEFDNTSKVLADAVYELVSSLGMRATLSAGTAKVNGKPAGPRYRVSFAPVGPCFRLPRKLNRQRKPTGRSSFRYVVDVAPVESAPVRCIQVAAASGTYLVGRSMIPTHNSHFVRVALVAWCLGIPGLQCVLIRKKYADILQNHVEGPTGFRALLAPLVEAGEVVITQDKITFPRGSQIAFQHCQDERQFDSAQGVEKHVLVIDEATQISERLIRFFRTWVRMPREMREILPAQFKGRFPRIVYTANPIGQSVPFFRRNFVQLCPDESIVQVDGFKRQYLLSRYTDNYSVDEESHKGRLAGIGDQQLAKALDEGDWNAITGEFFPEWDEDRHVIKYDFTPPSHWTRFRTFDWGSFEPFAVYWLAVSDGEPFRSADGKQRWLPRGALVVYAEWYGCDPLDPSKGCKMRNEDIADGIVYRSELGFEGVPTLTDSLPFQDRGGETIAQTFQKRGVTLTLGDTSRVAGWSQMRSRLIGIQYDAHDEHKYPLLYVSHVCRYARDYIPALPRHPSELKKEDAAEHGEATHACDAIRLGCMAHTIVKDRKEPTEARVRRALATKPTMKRIAARMGNGNIG